MISVSTKHALKALIALNAKKRFEYVPVLDLAKEIKVPSPYLSKVAKSLAQAELVESRKGPGGGVRISESGQSASFYDVCLALEDPVVRDACFFSKNPCSKSTPCALHQEWAKAKSETVKFLKKCLISEFTDF